MLGALFRYLRTAEPGRFQPMNSNFGLVDPLEQPVRDKGQRRQAVLDRARSTFAGWMREHGIEAAEVPGSAASVVAGEGQ
jgi:methylenetetrahydrofolate--tRNA-(uracil-5-)-methyltransferase